MIRKFIYSLVILTILYVAHSCNQKIYIPEEIDFAQVPYSSLSEYGFFKGEMSNMIPQDRVLLYEPVSQLFSDYAEKSRFVWMPEGVSASIVDTGSTRIVFEDHSILVKNFYYPHAENNEQRIMETRLLVKDEGIWNAYAYIWNDDQTDAEYKITGASIPVSFTNSHGTSHSIKYVQPNKNQCKSCHNQNEKLVPIGPKARNLNFEIAYPDGSTTNQLEKWTVAGYLDNFKSKDSYSCMVNYNDKSASLDKRARAYLDINCAHCHATDAPANTSGLLLAYEDHDDTHMGIYKPPIAAGIGAGSFIYDIHPGKADSSIFIYRMESSKPGIMMPEIGRAMVHEEGVELIREWIDGLE